MREAFEGIISTFLENKVGLHDHFLTKDMSHKQQGHLLSLYSEKQLKVAGVGANSSFLTNQRIRSDVIYWLDRKHNNIHENSFLDLIDEFVKYLNATCYTGITDYEFHYAYYDKGSSYKRHLDQFRSDQKRAYSMILYLNNDWILPDGGQLCIYQQDGDQVIDPLNGKCVFFKSSELEHEVLLNHKPRMSITGWLKTS